MEFLTVTWADLHRNSYRLAEAIVADKKQHDLIVAIARGGMSVAQILSDFLTLPVATFTVSSYRDMQQTKLSDISFHVGGTLTGKRILLLDDISDSGKTFARGIEYLHGLGATSITTAAPYIKPWTKYVPDHYVEKTDRWIVMPYEIRETVSSVAAVMKKEGATPENIRKTLTDLGIADSYINAYINDV